MDYLNSYNSGAEYTQDTNRAYPAVSLIYDKEAPVIGGGESYQEGAFIGLADGTLVAAEDWTSDMVADHLYVSDGKYRVRLALKWCNENNCDGRMARSGENIDWVNYTAEEGTGDLYGNEVARLYRWICGAAGNPVKFNEIPAGVSIYHTYDFGGAANTAAIVANQTLENYPAFHAATSYKQGENDSHDWYLPAITELQMCFKYMKSLNACAEKCGADKFDYETSKGYPWSSSLCDGGNAWCLSTSGDGYVITDSRSYYCCVRAAF